MAENILKAGDALMIVDVQIDFCPGGCLPVPEGDRVIPVLNAWIRRARAAALRAHEIEQLRVGGLAQDVCFRASVLAACEEGFRVELIEDGMRALDDAAALDIAYKLVDYAGRGRMKLSSGTESLPGAKQIYRRHREGRAHEDVIARRDEAIDGIPLLELYLRGGRSVRLSPARRRASRSAPRQ